MTDITIDEVAQVQSAFRTADGILYQALMRYLAHQEKYEPDSNACLGLLGYEMAVLRAAAGVHLLAKDTCGAAGSKKNFCDLAGEMFDEAEQLRLD